jgi:hypothetical protein
MRIRETGVGLAVTAVLLSGCDSAPSAPQPSEKPAATTSVSAHETAGPRSAGPWAGILGVQQCAGRPDVFYKQDDPDPRLSCALGALLKSRIDNFQLVSVFTSSVLIREWGASGVCVQNPLDTNYRRSANEIRLGLAHVRDDGKAQVMTTLFEGENSPPPPTVEVLAVPGPDGVFRALDGAGRVHNVGFVRPPNACVSGN